MPHIVLLLAAWMLDRNATQAQVLYHTYAPLHILSANFSERLTNPLTASINPAMAPNINSVAISTLIEKKYLTDLHSVMIAAGYGFHTSGISVALEHFGNVDYTERSIGASFGKSLGRINLGTTVKFTSVDIAGFSPNHFIQNSVATAIKITETVTASAMVSNLNFFILKSTDEVRPASGYSLGLGWQVSSLVYTGIEYIKRENQPLNVVVDIQYSFANDLSAMLNWTTATNQPYVNIAWMYGGIRVAAGCSYHSSLGISPAITMAYNKKKYDK